MLTIEAHPLLDLRAFVTRFPRPLGEMASSPGPQVLLSLEAAVPLRTDEIVRDAVRRMLRHSGFRPAGRSKPASEYLLKAIAEAQLTSINLAVAICNIVSLHSGLPISVVDMDRGQEPFRVAVAPAGA